KSSPAKWRRIVFLDFSLGEGESFSFITGTDIFLIKVIHERLGDFIADFKQSHDNSVRSGQQQRTLKPKDPFTVQNLSPTGFASAQNNQIRVRKIERSGFIGCQYPSPAIDVFSFFQQFSSSIKQKA